MLTHLVMSGPVAIASILAQQADAPANFQGLPFPLLMIIILVTGYLLVFRPQQKKQSEMKAQLESLKEKDRVVTIGGIHGRVTNVGRDGEVITIQVDETTGAKMRINKSAVARVVTDQKDGSSDKP